MKCKWIVDSRAYKYYMDRTNGAVGKDILFRRWNAMVEAGIQMNSIYKAKKDNEYKVYVGKMKFTIDMKHNLIKYIDCADFKDINYHQNFNNNKMKFNLDMAAVLKEKYSIFGLNTLGNKIIMDV